MAIEKVTCLLCHGIVSFKGRNQSRFVDHMEEEHNVRYDFPVLLVASLMDEAERDAFVFQNKNKFEPQIEKLVSKENVSSTSADRNVCNRVLEEHQNKSLVYEDSLYETSSEGEDSIIVCKEVSREDRGRFIEVQGNEFHQCVTCAKYIELSERAEHDLAHIIECKVSEGLALSNHENGAHRTEIFEKISVEPNINDLTNVEGIFDDLIAVGDNSDDIMNVVRNLDLINIDDLLNYDGNEGNVNYIESGVKNVSCVERNIEEVTNVERSNENVAYVFRSIEDETTVERRLEEYPNAESGIEDVIYVERRVEDDTNVGKRVEDITNDKRSIRDVTNVERSVEDVKNMISSIKDVKNLGMNVEDVTISISSVEDVTYGSSSFENITNVGKNNEDENNLVVRGVEDINNLIVRSVEDITIVEGTEDVIDMKENVIAAISLVKEQSLSNVRNCYKRKRTDTEKEVRKNFFCKHCNIRLIAFGGLKKHMKNYHPV